MANDFPKKREGCNNEKESVGLRVSGLSQGLCWSLYAVDIAI